MKTDPLKPEPGLLCKLGSIAVHAEELMSADGHQFDAAAIRTILSDAEVRAWLKAMDRMSFLPKKRK